MGSNMSFLISFSTHSSVTTHPLKFISYTNLYIKNLVTSNSFQNFLNLFWEDN